jgi:hypothetical protein
MKDLFILLTVFVLFAGCDTAAPQKKGQRPAKQRQNAAPNASAASDAKTADKTTEKAGTEDVKAEAGVGAKGHIPNSGGERPMDIITVPLNTMFWAKDKIMFDKMKHALNVYKTEHNERFPASTEEFMTEIIQANSIKLPVLPAGEEYVFDSQAGELKVRRPKPKE